MRSRAGKRAGWLARSCAVGDETHALWEVGRGFYDRVGGFGQIVGAHPVRRSGYADSGDDIAVIGADGSGYRSQSLLVFFYDARIPGFADLTQLHAQYARRGDRSFREPFHAVTQQCVRIAA